MISKDRVLDIIGKNQNILRDECFNVDSQLLKETSSCNSQETTKLKAEKSKLLLQLKLLENIYIEILNIKEED